MSNENLNDMKTLKIISMRRVFIIGAAFLLFITLGCNNRGDRNETMVEEQHTEPVTQPLVQDQPINDEPETMNEDQQATAETKTSQRRTYTQSWTPAPERIQYAMHTESFGNLEEAILTAGQMRDWDRTGDGKFDAAEFYVVLYHIWDRNHDGKIDQDEWEFGINNFLDEYNQDEYGNFREWDEDGNNKLDINEFARGIENAGLFNASSPQEGDIQDQQQEWQQQEDGERARKEGEYLEPASSIVIWNRRGEVEQIVVEDHALELVENVGRRD
jgi:hypothetical protein